MAARGPRYLANGNINVARIVKIDNTAGANFRVIQADASSDKSVGISQQGTYQPPGVVGSDAFAAHAGQPVFVAAVGEETLLLIGTGGCTQGDLLTSDASGQGVTIAFTAGSGTVYAVAFALEAALFGELARVCVLAPHPITGITA